MQFKLEVLLGFRGFRTARIRSVIPWQRFMHRHVRHRWSASLPRSRGVAWHGMVSQLRSLPRQPARHRLNPGQQVAGSSRSRITTESRNVLLSSTISAAQCLGGTAADQWQALQASILSSTGGLRHFGDRCAVAAMPQTKVVDRARIAFRGRAIGRSLFSMPGCGMTRCSQENFRHRNPAAKIPLHGERRKRRFPDGKRCGGTGSKKKLQSSAAVSPGAAAGLPADRVPAERRCRFLPSRAFPAPPGLFGAPGASPDQSERATLRLALPRMQETSNRAGSGPRPCASLIDPRSRSG